MTAKLFTPRASRELSAAAVWIADENPAAAENLLAAALVAHARADRAKADAGLLPLLVAPRLSLSAGDRHGE